MVISALKKKILIWDTSILCVYVKVPGKETCGSNENKWDYNRVKNLLEGEYKNANYILPIASIIETGNHITNSKKASNLYDSAKNLSKIIKDVANANTPWAAFTQQDSLWSKENLLKLAEEWPREVHVTTIGDYTIKNVAEYYAQFAGKEIIIFTADMALKSYEPQNKPLVPRRKK